MEKLKKDIIETYLKNNLQLPKELQDHLVELINPLCTMQYAMRSQLLECEGRAKEGRVWLSPEAMSHGYHYDKASGNAYGTQIWKKAELILFPSSLIQDVYRYNYIQMLEPGHVLSISYKDAIHLRTAFREIAEHIEHIGIRNELAYQRRIILLNEPSRIRLEKFEAENVLFCNVASDTIKAMHLALTRQGYLRLKNRRK